MPTTITQLPTPPSRADSENFAARADAFLGALPTFVTQTNTLASELNSSTNTASAAAISATQSANLASNLVEKYLGAFASDPFLDKNGHVLTAGDWYINTSSGFIRAYNGSSWVNSISASAGVTAINSLTGDITLKTVAGQNLVGAGSINFKTINGQSLIGTDNIVISSSPLVSFSESKNSSAPNVSVPVSNLLANSTESNIDVAIVPKGSGALLTAVPDNSSLGGNKRGVYAVDLQLLRNSAGNVASGAYSTLLGGVNNTAAGHNSVVVGGDGNASTALGSSVFGGYQNINNGKYSTVLNGKRVTNNLSSTLSFGGDFLNGQGGIFLSKGSSLGTTPSSITSDAASTARVDNTFVLKDNSAVSFVAICVARMRDNAQAKAAMIKVEGVAFRGVGAGSLVCSISTNTSYFTNSFSNHNVSFVTDTSLGSLYFRAGGVPGQNIDYVASIQFVEVSV